MRILSFISSLVVGVSFFLEWFHLPSGKSYTFVGILSHSISGSFQWLNPDNVSSLGAYVVFFAGILMILMGVMFGVIGGRRGPALGTIGMLVFTAVSWHIYGHAFTAILGPGYYLAWGAFLFALVFAGGQSL